MPTRARPHSRGRGPVLARVAATFALAAAAGGAALATAAQPRPAAADVVIENARIWSDGLTGYASFAAIRDGRFVHVGERDERYISPGTRRVDAGGRTVVPGLIDSHVHMLGGGLGLSELPLRAATSREDFVRRVRTWAAGLPEDAWIRGGRWSTESWADTSFPTREWIDGVSGGRPAYLRRMDGHSALVNSRALELAGITADSPPDPEGGQIDRDPRTGEPTGILRESAMRLVGGLVPAPTLDEQVAALRLAMTEANRHGITAVGSIPPSVDALAAYERLIAEHEGGDDPITVRFYLYPVAFDWSRASESAVRFEGVDDLVQVNGLKTYLDGTLGSQTAYMVEPFLCNHDGEEDNRGFLREGIEGGQFERNLAAAAASGLQTIAHAIGDAANKLLLDTLEETYADLGDARCRSEHAQHLRPEDIERFGRLGVIPSMQPYHKADDGRYAEDCIGPERSRSSYAFRSLLDAGAVLAFGSDWPVVSIDPLLGVEAATTARTLDGVVWQDQESITVPQALRGYTAGAAYSVLAEDEIGRILPGYRADFVILSETPFADPMTVDWAGMEPLATWMDGRCVWPRD